MTVGYSENVSTCKGFGNFAKMLVRWRGSIYKVIWAETLVYLICYFSLNWFYRYYINENCEKKRTFIQVVKYCDKSSKVIPVSFILSFYVGLIVKRWWTQWMNLPWPDNVALTVSTTVDGNDDRGRMIRRTILRYVNVAFVMSLQLTSTLGKLRFPSYTHMVAAGILDEHEKKIIDDMEAKTSHPKYWVPLVWAGSVATRARKEGLIRDDISLNNVVTVINKYRMFCQEMLNYDWVNVPIVYTQAVTLVVFTYWLSSLVGNQLTIIEGEGEPVDLYFPYFSFMEFFFYCGWLKIAEVFINPFGVDDDDFEVNWLIDRDFEVAYVIVDEMHQEHPNLLKDQYWDDVYPVDLPYTEATLKYKTAEGQGGGSTRNMEIPEEKTAFIKPESDHNSLLLKRSSPMKKLADNVSSQDSLKDAMRDRNSTYSSTKVRKANWAFLQDTILKKRVIRNMQRVSDDKKDAAAEGSIHESQATPSEHESSRSITEEQVRAKRGIKRNATGGYWTETGGTAKLNIKDLMETEDIPYDPSQDEEKQSEITISQLEHRRGHGSHQHGN